MSAYGYLAKSWFRIGFESQDPNACNTFAADAPIASIA